MIEVFARRTNTRQAAALVERLRAEGRHAREGNADLFDAEQIDRSVVMVYHDGEVSRIPAAYAPLDIPCELIPGLEPETAPEPEEPTGMRVVKSGPWHKLLGPDGEQIGKAQRSEADAWALAEEIG